MRKLSGTIGFIGCGNMGSAIISGLLREKLARPGQILVFDADSKKLSSISKKFRIRTARNNSDLIHHSQIVLLAIKPQDLNGLSSQIRNDIRAGQIVISILAGMPLKKLKRALGRQCQWVRAMPNLGAQVGEGIAAVTGTNQSALKSAEIIFSSCGKVARLPERHFDLVTAVSGSGPAYFFLMMELLSRMAVRGGIPRTISDRLAVQTALGAAKLAHLSHESPAELRRKVTSKKGTTEAALNYFSSRGLEKIFMEGVKRAVLRAKELSWD